MTKRQLEESRAKFENFDLGRYHILTYDEMLKVNGGCSSDDDSEESESSETSSESADFSDSGSVTESASGTATETSTESVSETCGHEIENSNEAVANAEVGDTLTRNDGTEVTITQGDIDWAQDYCDAHGIGWSRSGEEEAKANDGAKEGGQAASAENQTELENYDYDSGSSSSIKETESDYITDEKSGHEAKNEVSENSSAVSKSDKGGKEATGISSSRKNGNDCPDYVERCRMRDEMIAAKRNSELNNAPKNSNVLENSVNVMNTTSNYAGIAKDVSVEMAKVDLAVAPVLNEFAGKMSKLGNGVVFVDFIHEACSNLKDYSEGKQSYWQSTYNTATHGITTAASTGVSSLVLIAGTSCTYGLGAVPVVGAAAIAGAAATKLFDGLFDFVEEKIWGEAK